MSFWDQILFFFTKTMIKTFTFFKITSAVRKQTILVIRVKSLRDFPTLISSVTELEKNLSLPNKTSLLILVFTSFFMVFKFIINKNTRSEQFLTWVTKANERMLTKIFLIGKKNKFYLQIEFFVLQ